MKYHDADGNVINVGDRLAGSYGIPPIKIEGKVVRHRVLCFEAPGHTPHTESLKKALECLELRIDNEERP